MRTNCWRGCNNEDLAPTPASAGPGPASPPCRAAPLYHPGARPDARQKAWGACEHLHPSRRQGRIGEGYRRSCTSVAWVGDALAARTLHAEEPWNHPAFLRYVDRWMGNCDNDRAIQRQTWDEFVRKMRLTYRHNLPPAQWRSWRPNAEHRATLRQERGSGEW